MSRSRNLCAGGVGKKCIYANSIHMHTMINGIPVILKLAEFDSGFKLPIGDGLDCKKKVVQVKKRSSACCPECKCGSGEAAPHKSLKEKKRNRDACTEFESKESVVSIRCVPAKQIARAPSREKKPKQKPPKKERKIRQRRSYCVFKRKDVEYTPKKRKAEEPKRKPKVKKIETGCTYSTESIKCTAAAYRVPKEEWCPPVQKEKSPPPRPPMEEWCPPVKKEKSPPPRPPREEWCPPPQREKRPTFCKDAPTKKAKKTKAKLCRPVFVDAGTSTGSETVKHHYNVVPEEKTGFNLKMNAFGSSIPVLPKRESIICISEEKSSKPAC